MTTEKKTPYDSKRDEYIELLKPLFLPADPVSNDIILYFASLLRALGMEDHGWDPYAESRSLLEDINGFFFVKLPKKHFKEPERTHWRLGLILYSHILEMDAPYEVITNLLRFKLGKGYSPNPFFQFLTEREKKGFQKNGISTFRKIEIIKKLSDESDSGLARIFDEFYNNKLRNAIAHADFILSEEDFRCRGDISGIKGFRISYEELDQKIMCAKAFASAFFQIELIARQVLGLEKQRAIPYDPHYKGLMEVLVDDKDVMCGFRIHWPNNSESTYRRTKGGVEMTNCSLDLVNSSLSPFVNLYARKPGSFSPLVEHDASPVYTKLEGCGEAPSWPA
jgi:hypothetical protein